jgi:hypothetical protein
VIMEAARDEEIEHSGSGFTCTGEEVVDGFGAFRGFGVEDDR